MVTNPGKEKLCRIEAGSGKLSIIPGVPDVPRRRSNYKFSIAMKRASFLIGIGNRLSFLSGFDDLYEGGMKER